MTLTDYIFFFLIFIFGIGFIALIWGHPLLYLPLQLWSEFIFIGIVLIVLGLFIYGIRRVFK